jgi:hypothetical protein
MPGVAVLARAPERLPQPLEIFIDPLARICAEHRVSMW